MKRLLHIALLALAAVACSGGSDGPTAPGPVQRRLAVSYTIESANTIATMQEVQLLFDGQVIASYSGAASNALTFPTTLANVAPRSHRRSLLTARQVATPILSRLGKATGPENSVVVTDNA